MKFQSSRAFEKHLKDSFPDHLAHFYLFLSPCDYEKQLWTDHLIHVLKASDPNLQTIRFDALECSPAAVRDEVRAPTLWGGVRVIIVDQIDKAKPLEPFLELFNHPAPDVILIFRAAASKPVAEFFQKGKKELVALDVSSEKPWDREKRLHEWLRDEARREGKELPPEGAAELLRHLGTDLATLHQELKKVITFAGDKQRLACEDIETVCGSKDLTTGWQLAETVVWKRPAALHDKMGDLSFVFPFLGQIRYHLQLGAQIASYVESGVSDYEVRKLFPSVRPQNLDKFLSIAAERGSSFFLKALLHLYDFELAAKSTSIDTKVAFDIFQIKMHEKTHSAS